ncbi:putative UPF0481 protein [Cocos nucifera]|nr:putative UPF0481 protein [Cocos nucifera]
MKKADNFLKISFDKEKGLLEIPAIEVTDSTDIIFRNLIALEQCYKDARVRITCYSIFMDSIINTERDVALLSQEGIIDRGLAITRTLHFSSMSFAKMLRLISVRITSLNCSTK